MAESQQQATVYCRHTYNRFRCFLKRMKTIKSQMAQQCLTKQESQIKADGAKSIQPLLYSRFLRFLNKSKQTKLVNGIYNYYGKNFSIAYKERFNFRERWQEHKTDTFMDDYLLDDINLAYSLFSFTILIINVLTVWSLSTERYFETKIISDHFELYLVLAVAKTMEIIFKSLVHSQRDDWNRVSFKKFVKINRRELFCLFYFLFLEVFQSNFSLVQSIVELQVYHLLWKSASNIYKNYKLKSFALKYENQLKIFDLLANIFIQAHFFSILIFCASKIHPSNNWTTAVGIDQAPIFEQYLYAFYFSCTTMLTIGYGDITPKNPGEVIVVILIQITGVVSFGYLLNEMGHTLSKMRQEKQALEKDLQTVGKMSKYYNLEKSLENRAKKYILANHKGVDELRPDEENRLLMKLNDELRTEITNQNSLSILKTSIFYLCHWSKEFQSEIAKSLEKRLFSPNERLGEISGVEKIYIIKTGKVSIYMNRFNNGNKKLLRTITINPETEVSNNIYGYTSAFSNRPVHLQAIAKEVTTTYSVTKAHFMHCVSLNSKDFEYYHEIKCKIDQSSFCEEWEAPAIKNIREHYIPSKIFLIKKYRIKLMRETNERYQVRRRERRKFNIINSYVVSNAENINSFGSNYTLGCKTVEFNMIDPVKHDDLNRCSLSISDEDFSKTDKSISSFSQENLKDFTPLQDRQRSIELARDYIRTRKQTTAMEENQNKRIIAYIFETRKDYCNFFPKNNFNHILLRCEKENCKESQRIWFSI